MVCGEKQRFDDLLIFRTRLPLTILPQTILVALLFSILVMWCIKKVKRSNKNFPHTRVKPWHYATFGPVECSVFLFSDFVVGAQPPLHTSAAEKNSSLKCTSSSGWLPMACAEPVFVISEGVIKPA